MKKILTFFNQNAFGCIHINTNLKMSFHNIANTQELLNYFKSNSGIVVMFWESKDEATKQMFKDMQELQSRLGGRWPYFQADSNNNQDLKYFISRAQTLGQINSVPCFVAMKMDGDIEVENLVYKCYYSLQGDLVAIWQQLSIFFNY